MCFQILRYHRTKKRRTGRTDAAAVVRPLWNTPALKRFSWELYCMGRLAAEIVPYPQDARPCCKPQQWASLSSNTIISTHYCKWQEMVVRQRSRLMTSGYVLVKKLTETSAELSACAESKSTFLLIWGLLLQKVIINVLALRKSVPQTILNMFVYVFENRNIFTYKFFSSALPINEMFAACFY